MKKRLNMMCIAILVLLSLNLVPFGMMMTTALTQTLEMVEKEKAAGGDKEKMKQEMEQRMMASEMKNPASVAWLPILGDPVTMTDERTGRDVEVLPTRVLVDTGQEPSVAKKVVNGVAGVLLLVMAVVSLVLFIRLISRVNKGRIFEWSNVRMIRWLGLCLIVPALYSIYGNYMTTSQAVDVIQPTGYFVSYMEGMMTGISDLVLGMVALVVAEIFAIGLKQKEELALTI